MKITPSKLIGAVAAALLLACVPALAQCPQWDVSGEWTLEQSDGYTLRMNLQQNGKTVTGGARFGYVKKPDGVLAPFKGGDPATQRGSVSGNIAGDDFYVEIGWSSGSTGIYRGKVGAQGRIEGSTYDKGAPGSKANWFSPTLMKCQGANETGPVPIKRTGKASVPMPATPPPRPIKSTGKAATGANAAAGVPRIVVFNKPGQRPGTRTLTWDGGPDHPYAEVWVKVGDEDETKVVEQGKGSRAVTVEPGKTYLYILTDSGERLATDSVKGN